MEWACMRELKCSQFSGVSFQRMGSETCLCLACAAASSARPVISESCSGVQSWKPSNE